MSEFELYLFALMTGAFINGLSATLVESAIRKPVSFSAPIFTPSRPVRSLALSVVAGPAMLVNDALSARADGRIGVAMMLSCFVTAGFWMFACGVVGLELAYRIVH